MLDFFDPRSFGPPRDTGRALNRRHRPPIIGLFDEASCGPQAGDRHLSAVRRHIEWIGRHEWPARVVIVLGEIALAYVCFVFGLLVGAGVSPWLE
jgi:hypothetical protein